MKELTNFVSSEHMYRPIMKVNTLKLILALDDAVGGSIPTNPIHLTHRPDNGELTHSGRFWTRPNSEYMELPREDLVNEADYSIMNPEFSGTYFEEVVNMLREQYPIGRVRILFKEPYNCNSWHRDPEPRIHIPIHTNAGALFTINNHTTHMPADGSVYYTDTREYHTAMNGGEEVRVHIVAAIAYNQIND
jgi:hypothetical protein